MNRNRDENIVDAIVGVTLVGLTWEPHELPQAESRLHRYGAKVGVSVTYLIAAGTADEIIASTVIDKL